MRTDHDHRLHHQQRRGITLYETAFCIAAAGMLAAMLLPALGAVRSDLELETSKSNLRQMGMMHASYAADWDGRQWTVTPDDLTVILGGPRASYRTNYTGWDEIPPVLIGFDCDGTEVDTGRGWAIQQSWYTANCGLGNWRAFHTYPFNQYANGRVYDPIFFAPRYVRYLVEFDSTNPLPDYIASDCSWPTDVDPSPTFYFSSYCLSLAGQVHPDVFRGPSRGGAQRAADLKLGHETPSLAQAKFPDLKTHVLEHHWLNPPPDDPYIPDTGGVLWFFNMSDRAENATLFFDGSVRLLPNMEVLVSNDIVVSQGGDSLWTDDPACFGSGGYFEQYALPPSTYHTHEFVDMVSSHHIFTTDGILGRDTIFSGGE